MTSSGIADCSDGAKFMSALLTFILPDAIITPLKTRPSPYPKAIPVCQVQAQWGRIADNAGGQRAPQR
jgi:hypothetical protein